MKLGEDFHKPLHDVNKLPLRTDNVSEFMPLPLLKIPPKKLQALFYGVHIVFNVNQTILFADKDKNYV